VSRTSRPTADRPESISEIAARELAQAFEQLREPAERIGERVPRDPETVHKLRVATRRATATFDLLGELVPQRQAARWRRRLGDLRRTAAEARDLDVLLLGLDPKRSRQRRELSRRRRAAQPELHAAALRWRGGGRRDRQACELIERVRVRHALPEVSWNCFAQLRLAMAIDRFERAAKRANESVERMHRFRIVGKRLRYLFERAVATGGCPIDDAVRLELKGLQELLGSVNDRVVAKRMLQADRRGRDKRARTVAEGSDDHTLWSADWPAERLTALVADLRGSLTAIRAVAVPSADPPKRSRRSSKR